MKRRVIICLGLLLALCLVGDGIAMLCLERSTRHLVALAQSHEIQSLRSELALNGSRIESDFLAARSDSPRDASRLEGSARRFEESLDRCAACHHDREILAELEGVRDTFTAYREILGRLQGTEEGRTRTELERLGHGITEQIVEQTTAMTDRARHGIQEKGAAAAQGVRNAWIVLLATFLAALVVGGIIAAHLIRRLTGPIEELLKGIERVRLGMDSFRFDPGWDQEFRTLGAAFNKAYASLKTAQDSILQAEKMAAVGKLAAGFAHEVGNPLASISSLAQMMRRQIRDAEQRERIDLIMKEVQRTSGIVRDLLTFTRPANDRKSETVRLGELLDHAVKLLRYDKRARTIEIRLDVPPNLPGVLGRPDRLIQVFTNIMINAVDAIEGHRRDGAGNLSIRAREQGGRVTVEFSDDGPGMTPEQIRNAFDPFFTTKDPGKGTGLGLWICYQEIQRHQGSIRLEGEPGRGVKVTIELPARSGAPVA